MNITSILLVLAVALLFILASFSRIRKGLIYLQERDTRSNSHRRIILAVYGEIVVGVFIIILWFFITAVIVTNSISRLLN